MFAAGHPAMLPMRPARPAAPSRTRSAGPPAASALMPRLDDRSTWAGPTALGQAGRVAHPDPGQRGHAERGRVRASAYLDRHLQQVRLRLDAAAADLVSPPSTRSAVSGAPRSPATDLASSATDAASPSITARTRCARVVPRPRPVNAPRASGRQCGAPSPASAGRNVTPPLSGTSPPTASSLAGIDQARRSRPASRPPRPPCRPGRPGSTTSAAGQPPGDRRGQPGGRPDAPAAGRGEQERAGPVGALGLARRRSSARRAAPPAGRRPARRPARPGRTPPSRRRSRRSQRPPAGRRGPARRPRRPRPTSRPRPGRAAASATRSTRR